MSITIEKLWSDERGQDIAEYAVMLAIILMLAIATVRMISSNSANIFSSVGSAIH